MAFFDFFRQFNDPTPVEIYLREWQWRMRIGFCIASVLFLCFAPEPPFLVNRALIPVAGTLYLAIHLLWQKQLNLRGPSLGYVFRAGWLDIVGASFCVILDPFPLPPSLPLLFLAVFGNGMQHGLKVFLQLSSLTVALGSCIFAVRAYYFASVPGYAVFFYSLFTLCCLYYAYLLFTRIEDLKHQAEQLGARDALTGLYNRRAFQQSAEYLFTLQRRTRLPLVLMFADLDNFKPVNDKQGHEFGDKVLQRFSAIAQRSLRLNDIAARFGGDEFVFLLTDSQLEGAEQVALRLQHEFAIWAAEQDLNLSVSIGIGEVFPDYNQNSAALIHAVDRAMYRAKLRKGQPGVVIASAKEMQVEVS